MTPGTWYLWTATGLGGTVKLGVYDHPPPEGSGLTSVAIPEEDLFWFDVSMVRGAAQATAYLDRLESWFGDLG